MDGPLDDDAYVHWISRVFPSSDYRTLGLVSLLVALGVFVIGFAIARLGAGSYLDKLYPYVGAGATFWILVWLGWIDSVLVDVWNRVAPAFDVVDATYRYVIGNQLATSTTTVSRSATACRCSSSISRCWGYCFISSRHGVAVS